MALFGTPAWGCLNCFVTWPQCGPRNMPITEHLPKIHVFFLLNAWIMMNWMYARFLIILLTYLPFCSWTKSIVLVLCILIFVLQFDEIQIVPEKLFFFPVCNVIPKATSMTTKQERRAQFHISFMQWHQYLYLKGFTGLNSFCPLTIKWFCSHKMRPYLMNNFFEHYSYSPQDC